MKCFLLLITFLFSLGTVMAQSDDNKLPPSIGFQFSFIDLNTAQDLRTKSLEQVLADNKWSKVVNMNPALTINYMQGLHSHVDFMGRFTGSFLNYPLRNPSVTSTNSFYLEADANVNLKLLSNKYIVVPYLQGGIGVAKFGKTFMAQMPLGVGLQINLFDEAFIHINSNYRVPVTQRANYSLLHSFGIIVPVVPKKAPVPPPPPPPPPPPDKDGDGVLDADDDCPDVAGVVALKGCPDTDKDGIADKDDKCPNEAGMAKYAGCPIPDSDKDGINDENDKCPTVTGVARYDGCPIPDGDGDGINDEEDKCPAVPGDASNGGCPQIKEEVKQKVEFAAKKIFFNVGSVVLQKKSYKPLDEVVKVLNENPTLILDIEGHTDNTGKADRNQLLSEGRAAAVKAYLVSKGISESRLVAAGYGQDRPVADNKTTAGRAQNRRSELKLRSY